MSFDDVSQGAEAVVLDLEIQSGSEKGFPKRVRTIGRMAGRCGTAL
jgi:hypothetical protein